MSSNLTKSLALVTLLVLESIHTIRKRKKMAGQNTFQIFLLGDANMIGEH